MPKKVRSRGKPFQKGDPRAGRKKGSLNKATKDVREAFRRLVEENTENMTRWLQTVAEENPNEALKRIIDLAEYCIPKLQRMMISDPNGEPVEITWSIKPQNETT